MLARLRMQKGAENVRSWGQTRSDRRTVKTTRMTRSCRYNARWEASVVVNHVHVPMGASRRRSGRSLITWPIAPAA
jgi:hypothetical protein